MSRIRVTVDRLVLPGHGIVDQKALVEGLQAELRRALADPAARHEWAKSQHRPALQLGPLTLEPGFSGGTNFGIRMARAITKGMKP